MSNTLDTFNWSIPPLAPSAKWEWNEVPSFSVPLQQMSKWCWAAVGSGLRSHWKPTRSQCTIANNILAKTTCCTTGKTGSHPAACNVQKALLDAFPYLGHLKDDFSGKMDPADVAA